VYRPSRNLPKARRASLAGRMRCGLALASLIALPCLGQEPQPAIEDSLRAIARLADDGRFAEAESQARSLLDRVEGQGGPDSPAAAAVLDGLAHVMTQSGKAAAPETRAFAHRALDIRSRTLDPTHPDLARSFLTLGSVLYYAGDYQESAVQLRRALAIQEKTLGGDTPAAAYTMQVLASAVAEIGDLPGARDLYARALAIQRSALGPAALDTLTTLNNLAATLTDLGDLPAARVLYDEAVPSAEAALGSDHPTLGMLLDNFGSLLQDLHEDQAAIAAHKRALAIREKRLGPDHPQVAWSLSNLAAVLLRTGSTDEARGLYARAVSIREARLGADHPFLAISLTGLADVEFADGRLDAARALYERALSIRQASLGPGHHLTARSQVRLARLEYAANRYPAALAIAFDAEQSICADLRRAARVLPERQTLAYREVPYSALDLILTASISDGAARANPDLVARAWDRLVRSRALILDEVSGRHRIVLETQSPEVTTLWETLQTRRRTLAALLVGGVDPAGLGDARKSYEAARAGVDDAERALALKSATFRGERQTRVAGLDEVRAHLPAGSALLAYARLRRFRGPALPEEPQYVAFALAGAGGRVRVVPLGRADRIDGLIAAWRREVSSPPAGPQSLARYRGAGAELRAAVWDPVATVLGSPRRLFVVMDGDLNLVSLDTLPYGADSYLIESGPTLQYLSAERDLVRGSTDGAAGRGLLLVGGPDFDAPAAEFGALLAGLKTRPAEGGADAGVGAAEPAIYRGQAPNCSAFRDIRFAPLPGAGEEATDVARLWTKAAAAGTAAQPVTILTGREAGETAFKRLAGGRRVLHLATHGFWTGDTCAAPGAGLALAGANLRGRADALVDGDDGVLLVDEIASLDLRGVDLVVLSACQSGIGAMVPGEGVFGLRRAFQIAGARSLLMSLWPVGDHDAREWTAALYKARAAGAGTADAARAAGRALVEARRRSGVGTHPFFWGAFVAAGDGP